MVTVRLAVEGRLDLPGVVRDASMTEVWRGMVPAGPPRELQLDTGVYSMEVAGAEGSLVRAIVVEGASVDVRLPAGAAPSAVKEAEADEPVPPRREATAGVSARLLLLETRARLAELMLAFEPGAGSTTAAGSVAENLGKMIASVGSGPVGVGVDPSTVEFPRAGEAIRAVGVAGVGQRLVLTGTRGRACVLDPSRAKPILLPGKVVGASLDASGQHVIAELPNRRAAVFDVRRAKPRKLGVAEMDRVLSGPVSLHPVSTAGKLELMPTVRLSPAWMRDVGPPVRIALWTRPAGGAWHLDVQPSLEVLRELPNTLRFLRVSGPGRVPALLALPCVVSRIEIQYRPTDFGVRVVDADERAELMIQLLQRRQTRDAATLAASRLHGKMHEPIGAAEGALALVRLFAELDDPPPWSWFGNLAEWFPWLPDGRIAWVWYGLYRGRLGADEAREGLLDAFRRGVPASTSALMLLLDGLELAAQSEDDGRARSALAKVRTWVAAASPDSVRTRLAGSGQNLFSEPVRDAATSGNLKGVSFTELGAVDDGDGSSLALG